MVDPQIGILFFFLFLFGRSIGLNYLFVCWRFSEEEYYYSSTMHVASEDIT